MRRFAKITAVEAKLLARDAGAWITSVVLPTVVLLVLGSIPGLRAPDEALGGARFIDLFVPSLVVVTLAILGVNALPVRLATYRAKGVLRRLSTTPVHPASLLVAQLVLTMAMAVTAVVLLIAVGYLVFQIALPQHLSGFVAAVLLGMASLFTLGLMVAAVAPTGRAAGAMLMPLFFVVMFLGGVYVPRFFLPDVVVRIGSFTPPGVQSILDAWQGVAPQPLHLAVLASITLVAGAIAARHFRWE